MVVLGFGANKKTSILAMASQFLLLVRAFLCFPKDTTTNACVVVSKLQVSVVCALFLWLVIDIISRRKALLNNLYSPVGKLKAEACRY